MVWDHDVVAADTDDLAAALARSWKLGEVLVSLPLESRRELRLWLLPSSLDDPHSILAAKSGQRSALTPVWYLWEHTCTPSSCECGHKSLAQIATSFPHIYERARAVHSKLSSALALHAAGAVPCPSCATHADHRLEISKAALAMHDELRTAPLQP